MPPSHKKREKHKNEDTKMDGGEVDGGGDEAGPNPIADARIEASLTTGDDDDDDELMGPRFSGAADGNDNHIRAAVTPASAANQVQPRLVYTEEDYQNHIAFKERFHDILAADIVDPDDNTILHDGRFVEANTEVVVFEGHFYNKDGLRLYFISELGHNIEAMQQKQSNLERKIRRPNQSREQRHQLLQNFPKDHPMTIRDPWSQTDVDTGISVNYRYIPEWNNTRTAEAWARDNLVDQVLAKSTRPMTAQEMSELRQGTIRFDESLFQDYERNRTTHATESASPIWENDSNGGILDVFDGSASAADNSVTADERSNSRNSASAATGTSSNRGNSEQATAGGSNNNSMRTGKPTLTLNEDDPIQAEALKQILQAASVGDPDSPVDNPSTGFQTTLLEGNVEKWFRKMTPVWFSHAQGGFLSRYVALTFACYQRSCTALYHSLNICNFLVSMR